MRKPLVISDFAPNPWLYLTIWFSVERRKFSQFFISVPVPLPILCHHTEFYIPYDTRDTETGGPARLPAQLAGQWGQSNWYSVRCGNIFCTGPTRAAKTEQKSFVQAWRVQPHPTKDGSLSFVLFESPFTSVSTIRMGHPYLVSLAPTEGQLW
jgi:hypothetical protein